MNAKYNFTLQSSDKRRVLPEKIILGRHDTETIDHVVLKLLGFLLFFRERLLIEPRLNDDSNPYSPDLVQLDYELRPRLWVECGECSVHKLDKLAVKAPEAEIWVLKPSPAAAAELIAKMAKEELRPRRYGVVGFDPGMLAELAARTQTRNEVFWVKGSFDPAEMHLDFNGLWFESAFTVWRF